MNINLLRDQAHTYLSRGFSIIPVGNDKKPLVRWKEFQSRKASKEEVERWLNDKRICGIGIVTGKISNLVVLDAEKGSDVHSLDLPLCPIVQTGGGGWHFYFCNPIEELKNAVRFREKMDIRAEGGYVVAPPSLHPSGNEYKWDVSLDQFSDLPLLPSWLLDELKNSNGHYENLDWNKIKGGVTEGQRNNAAAIVIGKILSEINPKQWEQKAWPQLKQWNSQCQPPLSEHELRSVFQSIVKRELSKNKEVQINVDYFKPMSLAELMSKQFPETEWLVENLIPSAGIIAVSGAPASFKTWIVLDLALHVGEGSKWCDNFVTTRGRVLIVDEENGERLLQQRIKKLSASFELPIYVLSLKGFCLSTDTWRSLIEFSQKNEIKLIIFDALVRIHSSDENNAMEMAQVFKLLKEFTKAGITVLFTHHNRKQGILRSNPSQDMRGSSDILASVDCHIAVEHKDGHIVIKQTKLRQAEELKPFKLNIICEENEMRFEFAGEIDEDQSKNADFRNSIRKLLEQECKPMYKKELFDTLKKAGVEGAYSTFKTATREMVEKGELFEQKGEKNKVFCSLKPFENSQVPIFDIKTVG